MTHFDHEPEPLEDEVAQKAYLEALRRKEISDWRWLVSGERGRRVVWRVLSRAGIYNPTFVPDPHVHAFNAGRRDFGTEILATLMEHAPQSYVKMVEENSK